MSYKSRDLRAGHGSWLFMERSGHGTWSGSGRGTRSGSGAVSLFPFGTAFSGRDSALCAVFQGKPRGFRPEALISPSQRPRQGSYRDISTRQADASTETPRRQTPHLQRSTGLQSASERHLVGELEITPHGKTACRTRDLNAERLDEARSETSSEDKRFISSAMRRSSGPTPSIGESAPPRTW